MMANDAILIKACLDGNVGAFEQIVKRYQSLVCGVIYSRLADGPLSEELAQETFVQAWTKLDQIKEPARFRSWLCSIARSTINNHFRGQNRARAAHNELKRSTEMIDEQEPAENLARQEEQQMIRESLMKIPVLYREPLILFYREDKSIRAVAELMQLPEATVRMRLHRGRQKLRQELESRIESTVKKTAPGPKFSKAVMTAVGGGLAAAGTSAAAAASISAVSTAGGGTATAATGALLSAAATKIVAIAATALICAGVVIYSQAPDRDTTAPQADAAAANPEPAINENVFEAASIDLPHETTVSAQQLYAEIAEAAQQLPEPTIAVITDNDPPAETMQVRHPHWPGPDEHLQYMYFNMKAGPDAQLELWVRFHDAFRFDGTFFSELGHMIVIDSGSRRLTLDPNSMEAQLGPTWLVDGTLHFLNAESTLDEFAAWLPFMMFRGVDAGEQIDDSVQKLHEESDEQVSVYHVPGPRENFKIWVDNRTGLTEKMHVYKPDGEFEGMVTFDFSPICDSVFSTEIPTGYQVLPDREVGTISGWVIDPWGDPVEGAEVYMYPTMLEGRSDENGEFVLHRMPYDEGEYFPVMLWAVLPDQPELIAWTAMLNPRTVEQVEKSPLAGTIPGSPGAVQPFDDSYFKKLYGNYDQSGWFLRASEVVLIMEQGLELSGYCHDLDGNPVPEAHINVHLCSLSAVDGTTPVRFSVSFETRTDPEGYYQIRNLPTLWDNCEISLSVEPHQQSALIGDRRTITIADPTQPLQEDILLYEQGPTVRGVLIDNHGQPLPNHILWVQVDGRIFPDYRARTDEQGRFEMTDCPAAPGLQIRADLQYSRQPYPDVVYKVGYHPDQQDYEIELVATKPEIVIDAFVTDTEGNPLPFFPVEIFADGIGSHWKNTSNFHQRTDENGYVRFVDVPELKGLKLTCYGGLVPNSDRHESEQMQQYLEQLTSQYLRYKWTDAPVPLEPGRDYYKMHITVPE